MYEDIRTYGKKGTKTITITIITITIMPGDLNVVRDGKQNKANNAKNISAVTNLVHIFIVNNVHKFIVLKAFLSATNSTAPSAATSLVVSLDNVSRFIL